MPGMTVEAINDLVVGIKPSWEEGKFADLASTYQDLTAVRRLLPKMKSDASGKDLRFDVLVGKQNNARFTGLYDTDQTAVTDSLKEGVVPWRHMVWSWGYDVREMAMASGPERIVDILEARRYGAFVNACELLESSFWGIPATGDSDTTTPFGLLYWIVSNSSEGFNGGDPANYTNGAAGLKTATYAGWKNYTSTYSAYTKDSMVTQMRRMATKTMFRPPKDLAAVQGGAFGVSAERGYFTTLTVLESLENLLEYQNDNLGWDLNPTKADGRPTADGDVPGGGKAFLARQSVEYVPYLDTNQGNGTIPAHPIYQIDWSVFGCKYLAGRAMVESAPIKATNSHNVFEVFNDTTMNFLCTNRRKLGVIYKV